MKPKEVKAAVEAPLIGRRTNTSGANARPFPVVAAVRTLNPAVLAMRHNNINRRTNGLASCAWELGPSARSRATRGTRCLLMLASSRGDAKRSGANNASGANNPLRQREKQSRRGLEKAMSHNIKGAVAQMNTHRILGVRSIRARRRLCLQGELRGTACGRTLILYHTMTSSAKLSTTMKIQI